MVKEVKEVKEVNESKTLSLFTNLIKTPPKMAQNSVWPPVGHVESIAAFFGTFFLSFFF